jgi:predicted GNAT family acetyltransferase
MEKHMNINLKNLSVVNNVQAKRFDLALGDAFAFIDYEKVGNIYTLTHTDVPPAYEGQGIASQMTKLALEIVQAEGAEVIPSCPLTRAYIQHHPKYQPLVARVANDSDQ